MRVWTSQCRSSASHLSDLVCHRCVIRSRLARSYLTRLTRQVQRMRVPTSRAPLSCPPSPRTCSTLTGGRASYADLRKCSGREAQGGASGISDRTRHQVRAKHRREASGCASREGSARSEEPGADRAVAFAPPEALKSGRGVDNSRLVAPIGQEGGTPMATRKQTLRAKAAGAPLGKGTQAAKKTKAKVKKTSRGK